MFYLRLGYFLVGVYSTSYFHEISRKNRKKNKIGFWRFSSHIGRRMSEKTGIDRKPHFRHILDNNKKIFYEKKTFLGLPQTYEKWSMEVKAELLIVSIPTITRVWPRCIKQLTA